MSKATEKPAASPDEPSARPLEVAIAGAGPVGMTLALGLAEDGHRVTVHEELDGLSTESRASTFHPSTLEELASYGVVEDLEKEGLRVPDYQYRDRREGLIARLDFSLISGLTRYPYRIQVEQSYLTRVVLARLAACPNATVRFGAKVTAARTTGERAEYTVLSGGVPSTETADYVVAADGAGSRVPVHPRDPRRGHGQRRPGQRPAAVGRRKRTGSREGGRCGGGDGG